MPYYRYIQSIRAINDEHEHEHKHKHYKILGLYTKWKFKFAPFNFDRFFLSLQISKRKKYFFFQYSQHESPISYQRFTKRLVKVALALASLYNNTYVLVFFLLFHRNSQGFFPFISFITTLHSEYFFSNFFHFFFFAQNHKCMTNTKHERTKIHNFIGEKKIRFFFLVRILYGINGYMTR